MSDLDDIRSELWSLDPDDYGVGVDVGAAVDQACAAHAHRRSGTVRSHLEFAHAMVYPAGPSKGKQQRPEDDPIQRYVVQQLDSGVWSRIYWCGSPQVTGKTEVAVKLPLLRNGIDARLPVAYALPKLDSLNMLYASKIRPGMVTSGFGDYFPEKGPGSRGGRPPFLPLRDRTTGVDLGELYFLTPGAYGATIAVIIVDDADQIRKADDTPDWKGFEDLMHRADAYDATGQAIRIACGTIESDHKSIILVLVLDHGTGTRLHAQCPYCRTYQMLTWDHVRYEKSDLDAARESARYCCPHCEKSWSKDDRVDALQSGLWVHKGQTIQDGRVAGPEPKTGGILGILTTAYDCIRSDLGQIAAGRIHAQRLIESHGDYSLMREWVRYNDCTTYTADEQDEDMPVEITPKSLSHRSRTSGFAGLIDENDDGRKTWSCHYVDSPVEEAEAIAIGADVQGDRLYWQATAYSVSTAGWREWDIGWGYEGLAISDGKFQPWGSDENFRAVFHRFWEATLTRRLPWLPIDEAVIDVRFETDMVAAAIKGFEPWRAIHGHKGALPKQHDQILTNQLSYDRSWKPGQGAYTVITRAVRQLVHNGYRRNPGEYGSIQLPAGLAANNYYLRHLCSRRLLVDEKTKHERWVRAGARDDLLDCKTYGHAMILRRHRLIIDPPKPKRVLSAADWFGGQ